MAPFARCKLYATFLLLLTSAITALPKVHNLTDADETEPMCTDDTDFTGRSYNANDCLLAINKLEDTDYAFYRARDFEFLALGAVPRTDLDTIRLPRRYTVGTCTLVLAMLSTFPEYSLPGQVRQRRSYRASDRSKFTYLWSVAAWVDGRCDKKGLMGWCATGAEFSIGVFMVATGSRIEEGLGRWRGRGNSSSGMSLGLARLLGVDVTGEGDIVES